MSKRLSAFFKYAVVSVACSFSFVVFGAESLPTRELALSERAASGVRVGDTISYDLRGGDANAEARWEIDPKQGGLKQGILFRKGRLITPLAAGSLQLPALTVIDESGQPVAVTTPIQVTIRSNLPPPPASGGPGAAAPEAPKPEPPIGPLGLPMPGWIQTAVASVALILFLVAGFFILRTLKRRAARALQKMLPKKPYDTATLERLDALLKAGWLEKGNFKPFYFGVSEALKFYLGERFDFDARESTTSELFAFLRERVGMPGLTEGVVVRIERLFEKMDPVKFADVVPNDGEARAIHREARELVSSTRKIEAITPGVKR
jgi:hypothetical protein